VLQSVCMLDTYLYVWFAVVKSICTGRFPIPNIIASRECYDLNLNDLSATYVNRVATAASHVVEVVASNLLGANQQARRQQADWGGFLKQIKIYDMLVFWFSFPVNFANFFPSPMPSYTLERGNSCSESYEMHGILSSW